MYSCILKTSVDVIMFRHLWGGGELRQSQCILPSPEQNEELRRALNFSRFTAVAIQMQVV